MEHTAYVEWQESIAMADEPLIAVVLSVIPALLPWLKKYGISSILNTPCGNRDDCDWFLANGIEKLLAVDLQDWHKPNHIVADLCVWKPSGRWDAAYVNCFFCTSNDSRVGGHIQAADNIASWPVKYIIVLDTLGYDWRPHFKRAGWTLLERLEDSKIISHPTYMEIWGHAN